MKKWCYRLILSSENEAVEFILIKQGPTTPFPHSYPETPDRQHGPYNQCGILCQTGMFRRSEPVIRDLAKF